MKKVFFKELKYFNYLKKRYYLIFILNLFVFFLIFSRITYLQLINYKFLINEGDIRSLKKEYIFYPRGTITDRFGKILAISVPVYNISINPQLLKRNNFLLNDRWKLLVNSLSISNDHINKIIEYNKNKKFTYLARNVNFNKSQYIMNLGIPGINLQKHYKRYYPLGEITAHILGMTDIDDNGIDGIEKTYNSILSSKYNKRITRKNNLGEIIEYVGIVKKNNPGNIILSIDEKLQSLVYLKLKRSVINNNAKSGSAILIDIDTGEILAMANVPSYDPNNFNYKSIDAIRNRIITDVFEPGSTVKPILIASALMWNIIEPDSIINTSPYNIGKYLIRDSFFNKKLSVTEIIKKSSNVGVSKISLSMPINLILDTYSKFGFDKKTNIGLIGEHKGIYPKKAKFSKIERAIFSYGYGFMITPIQLAKAYTIIGNKGIDIPLSIIRNHNSTIKKKIFSEKVMNMILNMMEQASFKGGCGSKAAIKEYRVAIKTGTVKKINLKGRYENKYIAYTAGVAPVSNPKFSLVILIDDPKNGRYYGGSVSAPIFSSIMGEILRIKNIKPDKK